MSKWHSIPWKTARNRQVDISLSNVTCIHYKLHMMGIPIDRATHIYGNSMSVINNTLKPKSVLEKKNNTVCYHTVRE